MKKKTMGILLILTMTLLIAATGCGSQNGDSVNEETELTILAAASLTDVCEDLKSVYEAETENVTLTFSFGGSGALQAQIEEGAPADMFISAAQTQMDALLEQALMVSSSVTDLLENKVVLIVPQGNPAGIESFEDVLKADIIGIGEVSSVPVGQYSEEIFTDLGIWDQVRAKANFGSDVRTVLSWVESGEVDCGVVYATDAYTGEGIEIICEAPADTHQPVIYPAGIVAASQEQDAAASFLEFLQSDEAAEIFEKYGFTVL